MDCNMRVAVLISGRAARYEVCLKRLLEKNKHEYDLFISVNDEPCKYYDVMKESLQPWLKGLEIKPFSLLDDFENHHPVTVRQSVNGKFVPQNVMSMFYNDMNAFNMATKYADDNGFEYDAYLKYRSDIIADDMPNIVKSSDYKIFSTVPSCDFTVPLIDRNTISLGTLVPLVSDAIAYGNRESMNAYCKTYEFILEMNLLWEKKYQIHFETCLTQNVYDKNISVERFSYSYEIDGNRRIFDTVWENSGTEKCGDSRINNIRGAPPPINSKDVETTEHIDSFPMV